MAGISRGAKPWDEVVNRVEEFDDVVVQGSTDKFAKKITKDKFKDALAIDIAGISLMEGGTLASPTVLPAPSGTSGDKVYKAGTGFYSYGGNTFEAPSGKDWYLLDNGTSWSLKDMGALPVNEAKDSFNPEGTEIANERSTANYINYEVLNSVVVEDIKSNEILLPASSQTYAVMMNDVPSPATGVINKMEIRSIDAGIAKFQVIKKMTNNYPNPITGNKEQFLGGEKFTVNVVSGTQEYQIPNIPINEGEYVAWINENTSEAVRPAFTGVSTSFPTGRWRADVNGYVDTQRNFTYTANAGLGLNFTVHVEQVTENYISSNTFDAFKQEVLQEVKINKITATRNANNYNSIRDLVKSITDATQYNQYEITVPNGEWFEYDLQMKKYIKLFGQERDKTILYCDGNNTDPKYVAPTDSYYLSEAGKQLATIAQNYLHVFFVTQDTHVENMTIRQVRGKYCTHIDNEGFSNVLFKNVRLIEVQTSYPIGIGVRGNQSIVFENFIIEREVNTGVGRKLGIFIHNWNNQSAGSYFKAENGRFIGCGYMNCDELGSGQYDNWNLINCSTDSIGEIYAMVDEASGASLWTNPVTGVKEPDPKDVPYCINLNTFGTKVDLLYDRVATNFVAPYNVGTQRPNFHRYMTSDFVAECLTVAGSGIVKGDILAYDNSTNLTKNYIVAKKNASVTDTRLGIALENAVDGAKLKYAPINKFSIVFITGAVGAGFNDMKLKYNGSNQLVSDNTIAMKDAYGLALEPKASGTTTGYAKLIQ